jgi:acyl dehydratase
MADILYLDDLRIGDTFKTEKHSLDVDQVTAFARQFDPQPFHLDDAQARESIFAGLAASGWHVAAITMRLLVTSGPRLAGGIVGAGGQVAWKAPTRPTDVLHVESDVAEITLSRSRPDRGMVVLRSRTLNQHGLVVQEMTATLVVPRRPA